LLTNSKGKIMTTKTVIASVLLSALPALGANFEGGTFAGITTRADGGHCAVVLLPGTAEDLAWEAAKAWAVEQGGELPTRSVAALLFANVQPALSPEWHWTADEYTASYAWYCDFFGGFQNGTHKTDELAAVAVRLIPLSS
jgi:hypothetical protein